MLKITLLLFFTLIASAKGYSQDNNSLIKEQGNKGNEGASRLTIGLGHTHVSAGKIDGDTKWLALPSWSLNYDYWLSNKFAIGIQNDLILESFIIELHPLILRTTALVALFIENYVNLHFFKNKY
jgi:hypothetical protein